MLSSSRVKSASNMCIAMLRVEIVELACMSRLLTLASWPNTRSPPVTGHSNLAASAAPARRRECLISVTEPRLERWSMTHGRSLLAGFGAAVRRRRPPSVSLLASDFAERGPTCKRSGELARTLYQGLPAIRVVQPVPHTGVSQSRRSTSSPRTI